MPVVVKSNFTLKTLIPDIKKNFAKDSRDDIADDIVSTIKSGKSPVKGFGKYEKYSQKYAEKKKGGKRLPVTLTDTGRMLKSIKTFITSKGNVSIFFSSPTAKFHDVPGLARVLRKMLPEGGEFISSIQNKIVKGYNSAVAKAVKKQNR